MPRVVLLFGGTFDPVTRRHRSLASAAARAVGADATVLIPAAISPHKTLAPGATGEQRAEMLRRAFASDPRAKVWTVELDRPPPSYFVDTLESARGRWPDSELRSLVGADQARSFRRWRESRRILELARPVVAPRDGQNAAELEAERAGSPLAGEQILEIEATADSATAARDALAQNKRAAAAELIDSAALAYIDEQNLYQNG